MKKIVVVVIGVVVILGGIALGVSLLGNKNSTPATNNGQSSLSNNPPPTAKSTNTVAIRNFAFSPAAIKITAGTKVTWTNFDVVVHTVTSQSGPTSFNSGTIANNGTFSYTFNKPGVYKYYCAIHPYMKGEVYVK